MHERSTAIFTITLSQYAPAAVHGEEDRVTVRGAGKPAWLDWAMHPCLPAQSAVHLGSTLATTCAPSPSRNKAQDRVSVCCLWWCHVRTCTQTSRLTFVDMPGSERLAMDPEVLLLREGVLLNKSLLDFSRGERLRFASRVCPKCNMGCRAPAQACSGSTGMRLALLMSGDVCLCSCVPCCAVLRQLVQEGSAEFVGYNNSILMQLLAGTCEDILCEDRVEGEGEAVKCVYRCGCLRTSVRTWLDHLQSVGTSILQTRWVATASR